MVVPKEAISPGSTGYGDRQTLEAGLAGMGGAGGGPETQSPVTALPAMGNPVSDMLSGTIQPPDQPLTSGMSVGAGPGPAGSNTPGPLDNDLGSKLKMIASQSTSPTLRRMAINSLRRMYRDGG